MEKDPDKLDAAGKLEQLGTVIGDSRSWFAKIWKLALLMTKGSYLLHERRRLFEKLGEEVYYRILKGEWRNAELEPLVHQLERLTKKVEIEEMLIRGVRFGTRAARPSRHSSGSDSASSAPVHNEV